MRDMLAIIVQQNQRKLARYLSFFKNNRSQYLENIADREGTKAIVGHSLLNLYQHCNF